MHGDERVGAGERETVVGSERVNDLAQGGGLLVDAVGGRSQTILKDRLGVS